MPPKWLQDSEAEPHSWQAGISHLREGNLGEWHCQSVSLQGGVEWDVWLGTAHLCDGSLPSDVQIFPLDNVSGGGTQDSDMPWARQALSILFPAFVLSSNHRGSSRGRAGVGLVSVFWDQSIPCAVGSGFQQPGDASVCLPVPLEPRAAWLKQDSKQGGCCTDPEG